MKPADSSSPLSPTRVRITVLRFICALSLITYLDRVCIMRVQRDIQRDLSLSREQMGLVFSAFLLGYMLFEVPGGWMGDRWGSRRVLLRIVVWWSLFTALTGFIWPFHFEHAVPIGLGSLSFTVTLLFNSFLLLLLVRFLFGCGEAGAYPNLARVVGSWFPFRERAFAQGGIWFCARMGGAVAPFVIGRLSEGIGWRRAFWVLGLVGVAWCVLFAWWFRDRPEDHPKVNEAELDEIRAGPHSWQSRTAAAGHGDVPWRQALTSANLWAVCLAAFCVSFGWYFYPTWQPDFLEQVHQISFRDSEIITGLPFACGAIGCLVGGRLSDRLVRTLGRRWGRSLIGVVGFAGAGLCVLATGFVAEAWQAVALLCLAFFVNDFAIPVIWSVSTDIGGRHAGTVAGFMNTIGAVGGMISPAMTPYMQGAMPGDWSAAARWQATFAVLAAAWFVAAAAWLRIDASRPLFREEGDDGPVPAPGTRG